MSRSRKKRNPTPNRRPAALSATGNCDAVEKKAQAALASGRHKDAIALYKSLLKEERRSEWLSGLASAYAARASELADKGLFKEALVIWEQRAASCETALLTSNYVVWTLQSGNIDAAAKLVTDSPDAMQSMPDRVLVAEYFAAMALAGETRILELLPAEDPVVRDHADAEALLMAFCNGEAIELQTRLKAIPHRSPYRDFRQIIKAWQLAEQAPADLPAAVNRISRHSPFRSLANSLLELHSPESQSVATTPREDLTLTLKAAVNGWSGKQLDLLKAAGALGPSPNAKALFNLLVRFATVFEEPVARSIALKLLIDYPLGKQGFAKHFGKLSPFEVARFEAQLADLDGDAYLSDEAWREVLDELKALRKPGADRLREALVYRRLANQWLEYERDLYPQPQVVEDLIESLAIDPDDVATNVQLIDLQRKSNNLKGARASVKQALERLPDNTAILIEAVQTAIAGNAFKKAATIARQLLKLDPINVKVQGILLDAHLAHGRKQIKTKKFDLARRELVDAASWARSPEAQGRVKLINGLLECSAQQGAADGRRLLKEGVELCGGSLVGQYQLLVEAQKLDLQRKNWLKIAALPRMSDFASREPVVALIRAVSNTQGLEDDDIYGTLLEFETVLRKSVKEPYTRPEMEMLCETLHRFGVMRLLQTFARRALEQWPEQTVFVFHALYAKANGMSFKLNERDFGQLDDALDKAQSDGDSRTAHRIMEFMQPPGPFGFPPGFPPRFPPGLPHGFPSDLPEDLPADLAALMDEIGPETLGALLEAMEEELGGRFDDLPPDNARKPARKPKPKKRVAKPLIPNPDQKELF